MDISVSILLIWYCGSGRKLGWLELKVNFLVTGSAWLLGLPKKSGSRPSARVWFVEALIWWTHLYVVIIIIRALSQLCMCLINDYNLCSSRLPHARLSWPVFREPGNIKEIWKGYLIFMGHPWMDRPITTCMPQMGQLGLVLTEVGQKLKIT